MNIQFQTNHSHKDMHIIKTVFLCFILFRSRFVFSRTAILLGQTYSYNFIQRQSSTRIFGNKTWSKMQLYFEVNACLESCS